MMLPMYEGQDVTKCSSCLFLIACSYCHRTKILLRELDCAQQCPVLKKIKQFHFCYRAVVIRILVKSAAT